MREANGTAKWRRGSTKLETVPHTRDNSAAYDGTPLPSMGFKVTSPDLEVKKAGTLNAAIVSHDVPATMVAGNAYIVHTTVQNSGSITWSNTNYELASIDDPSFGSPNAHLDSGSLSPGQRYKFTFTLTALSTPGTYHLEYQMSQNFGPRGLDKYWRLL